MISPVVFVHWNIRTVMEYVWWRNYNLQYVEHRFCRGQSNAAMFFGTHFA